MKKKATIAAAAVLAAGLATGAMAKTDENFIPGETKQVTMMQPEIGDDGQFKGFKEVSGPGLVERTVAACVKDKAGNPHTVKMQFILAISADDVGIDANNKTLADIAPELATKFPADKADAAVAFIQQGWQKAVEGFTKEEIMDEPSQKFIESISKVAEEIISDKRLSPNEPSFEEKTKISIGPARLGPAGATPGCAP